MSVTRMRSTREAPAMSICSIIVMFRGRGDGEIACRIYYEFLLPALLALYTCFGYTRSGLSKSKRDPSLIPRNVVLLSISLQLTLFALLCFPVLTAPAAGVSTLSSMRSRNFLQLQVQYFPALRRSEILLPCSTIALLYGVCSTASCCTASRSTFGPALRSQIMQL